MQVVLNVETDQLCETITSLLAKMTEEDTRRLTESLLEDALDILPPLNR